MLCDMSPPQSRVIGERVEVKSNLGLQMVTVPSTEYHAGPGRLGMAATL
jgi:hypothetical protein